MLHFSIFFDSLQNLCHLLNYWLMASITNFYRPQRSCGKVKFLHLSVSHSVHRGVCMAGGMHGRGVCVWQGACMAGVCVCVAGGMHGRGHVWQGVCVAGGMHSRDHVWQQGMHGTHVPPLARYYEIRSMSGRYASYFNHLKRKTLN